MSAIVADDVRKAYGDTVALRGVSLAVDPGEVFALIGPNGAGKTTLVRCLTGTTAFDAGSTRLLDDSPAAIDKSRLGLLPQEFTPHDRLTARELIDYYGGLYDRARDVRTVLEDTGLDDVADTWYANLSGGERRRALVGTAIVNDPDVLFLDEPTTGIDPAGRRAVWSLIADLVAGGTTVFLTTHSMEEAERLADRVGVLVDGELVTVGSPDELVAEYGGTSRLIVEGEIDDEFADLDLDRGTYTLTPTDRGLVIEGVEARAIGEVVDALDAAGVAYDALTWREPDLETVYLSLTGQTPPTDEHGTIPAGGSR